MDVGMMEPPGPMTRGLTDGEAGLGNARTDDGGVGAGDGGDVGSVTAI